MYNIEKYTEGNLDQISLNLFEKKMKKDVNFRKKVNLYKNVDIVMKGAVMAAVAEIEMNEKGIDSIAAGFVNDFFARTEKPENIKEYLFWS